MGGKVPILKTIQKVPGGLMVVFLLLGAIVNTFAPKSLMIGSFTTALFKQGALPLIAVLLFCRGAQITIKTAGVALWKGFVLNTVKILLGISIGLVVGKLMGPEASLFGLTPLALIAAMANSNGGLYTALAQSSVTPPTSAPWPHLHERRSLLHHGGHGDEQGWPTYPSSRWWRLSSRSSRYDPWQSRRGHAGIPRPGCHALHPLLLFPLGAGLN
jgi:hypothetical protein